MTTDPLGQGPQLFMEMMAVVEGHDRDTVLGACLNIIANLVRRHVGLRAEAIDIMNHLYGANMQMLMEHYDPVTGKRRSVIPFTQTVNMGMVRKVGNGHT